MPLSNNPHGLTNVLVTRFSALGDVAMTIPVVYSVCRCYPSVRFVFVTRESMTSMFLERPANLEIVGVNLKEYGGLKGLGGLFGELKERYGIDGYVDLHDVLRTKVLRVFARLKGVRVSSINKGRKGKRALTRRHNKVMLPLISSRARYRQAFHAVGLPVENRFDGFFHGVKPSPEVYASVTGPKRDGERWIGIAPFAKHQGKIYPLPLMEQVVARLSERGNVRLFLFGGGPEEAEVLGDWASRYRGTTSLAGTRLGFEVELSLLSCMDAMVSMDSANMHLASLTGTRVISVWGATHPYCGFKGWRQAEGDMVQLPMTCRPCSVFGNKPCLTGDYRCLSSIPPSMILSKLAQYVPELGELPDVL